VGNEFGIAGDPCWATLSRAGLAPGLSGIGELLNTGMRDGDQWLPAECDVSIRPGWFYHASEDGEVKTPAHLLDLYERSVGRGASLLLNLPPDRRGLVHENDASALREFHQDVERIFKIDLARSARASSPSSRGAWFAPESVNDGDSESFWTPGGDGRTGELLLEFATPLTFNWIDLREHIPLGQRVDRFAVDAWEDGGWRELAQAQAIGARRLIRLELHTAQKLRLRILSASAPAAIQEFGVYLG